MSVKLLTEHHLKFLSLKGGCTCSSESTLVKMPHCWKSRVAAHLLNGLGERGKPRETKRLSPLTLMIDSYSHAHRIRISEILPWDRKTLSNSCYLPQSTT